jgi:hypothetical protein
VAVTVTIGTLHPNVISIRPARYWLEFEIIKVATAIMEAYRPNILKASYRVSRELATHQRLDRETLRLNLLFIMKSKSDAKNKKINLQPHIDHALFLLQESTVKSSITLYQYVEGFLPQKPWFYFFKVLFSPKKLYRNGLFFFSHPIFQIPSVKIPRAHKLINLKFNDGIVLINFNKSLVAKVVQGDLEARKLKNEARAGGGGIIWHPSCLNIAKILIRQ